MAHVSRELHPAGRAQIPLTAGRARAGVDASDSAAAAAAAYDATVDRLQFLSPEAMSGKSRMYVSLLRIERVHVAWKVNMRQGSIIRGTDVQSRWSCGASQQRLQYSMGSPPCEKLCFTTLAWCCCDGSLFRRVGGFRAHTADANARLVTTSWPQLSGSGCSRRRAIAPQHSAPGCGDDSARLPAPRHGGSSHW